MIGLALEGGADRCAFTAGVVDVLMQHQFYASAASGTSAGAGCVFELSLQAAGALPTDDAHAERKAVLRHLSHAADGTLFKSE